MTQRACTAAELSALLPQTQCTRCGYPDCDGYAQAMAQGAADINRCPPGGAEGIARLADLTGRPVRPLDPGCGTEGPRQRAVIDEDWCIGCTLCLPACPTDAILGSNKRMHTVIDRWCTGCERCLPVCPVDCIRLEPTGSPATGWAAWSAGQAKEAGDRYAFHSNRIKLDKARNQKTLEEKARTKLADLSAHTHITDPATLERKRAVIEAALERARRRREGGAADAGGSDQPVG
ncbi:MAG: RnfABCDGE type electron transport complex subunit B [Rhodoferax sp.]|nr:RnfABCDGE type electron transport complex subunit B [Rhodoferax sp.]